MTSDVHGRLMSFSVDESYSVIFWNLLLKHAGVGVQLESLWSFESVHLTRTANHSNVLHKLSTLIEKKKFSMTLVLFLISLNTDIVKNECRCTRHMHSP